MMADCTQEGGAMQIKRWDVGRERSCPLTLALSHEGRGDIFALPASGARGIFF